MVDLVAIFIGVIAIGSIVLNILQQRFIGSLVHQVKLMASNYKADSEVVAFSLLANKVPSEGEDGAPKAAPKDTYK